MWRDVDGGKLAPVADHDRRSHEVIEFYATLDRLRGNKFSSRRLDQVLLAVSDGKKAILINPANVPSFEPTVHASVLGLLRPIPIANEHRRTTDQNLTIFRNAHFEVWQRFTNRPQLVSAWRVDCDHRRGLGKPIPLVNANANRRVPVSKFASKRGPS